jgi:predicted DCC family thiol-disulfide oxidoreductase YuxK
VNLLIFDGQCRICTASMRVLNRWDWGNRLAFLSLHDPRVRELCPDLNHDDLMREIYLLEPGGGRYGGVKALRIAAREVPVLWPIVPFLYIPGSLPIWAAAYRVFARWRYKFGRGDACEDGTCAVHLGRSFEREASPRG